MKNQSFKLIMGMLMLSGSSVYAAQVTNTPPWSAKDCHLGMNEWALLNATSEATGSAAQIYQSALTAAVEQKSDGNVTEIFQVPRKRNLPANPADMIPGVKESRAQMTQALAQYQGKNVEFLIQAVQQNPLIRQCRVSIKPGHFMESLARFNFKRRQQIPDSYFAKEIPLLAAISLADVVDFDFAQYKSTWDKAVADSLYDISEYRGEEGSFARQNVFYGTRDVLAYTNYPVREGIDESNFTEDVYIGASTIKRNGMALSYRIGMTTQKYPISNKTISQMLSPENRRDILFDDSVVNGLEIPFFGTSSMSSSNEALSFQIGTSAQEVSMKKSIETCTADTSGMRSFGKDFMLRLNRECGKSISMVGLFIPEGYDQIPKIEIADVTAELLNGKQKKNEISGMGSSMTSGISKKLMLAMSNQDTNIDILMKGPLLVTSRADLDLRLKKALTNLKHRALSATEYQGEFNRLSAAIPHLYFDVIARQLKTKQDQKLAEQEMRNFMLTGGMAYWLSFMDGDYQDTYAAQFSYRKADNRIGIVGLKSAKVMATELICSETGADKGQVEKAVNAFSGAGLNCAAQYKKFKELQRFVIPEHTNPKTRAEAQVMLGNLGNLYSQAQSASSGICSTAFAAEAKMLHDHAAEYLRGIKK